MPTLEESDMIDFSGIDSLLESIDLNINGSNDAQGANAMILSFEIDH